MMMLAWQRSSAHLHGVRSPCRPHLHAASFPVPLLARRRRHSVCRAATPAIDWNEVYAGKQQLPQRWVTDAVQLQEMQGKGRGLVASRDIAAGELLIVSTPLVYLPASKDDEEGQNKIPDVQQLLDKLNSGKYSEEQLQWLRAMYTGDAYQSPPPPPPLHSSASTATAPDGQQLRAVSEADVEEAMRFNILALNMFGEEFQDLPASIARGDTPTGHLGLWPEFSLLNHSCAPNAVNYTIGDRMVVRAAKAVVKGTELSINYLGRSSLRPAAERLLDLRDGYGFACACPRCALEMGNEFDDAVGAVQELYGAVMFDMVPGLQAALGGGVQPGDPRGLSLVADARRKLQPLVASLEKQLSQVAQGNSQPAQGGASALDAATAADWLRASAYEAYGLQVQLADVEQQLRAAAGDAAADAPTSSSIDTAAEATMLHVAGSVANASDLHLFLTVKALSRAQIAHGPESDIAKATEARAVHVLKLRYGKDLSEEVITKLLQASAIALDMVAV